MNTPLLKERTSRLSLPGRCVLYLIAAGIILSVVGWAVSFRSRDDSVQQLIERGVPVPSNARVTNFKADPTFERFLYVRFETEQGSLEAYRRQLPKGIALNKLGGAMVVPENTPNSELTKWLKYETELIWPHASTGFIPWWNLNEIETGTYHSENLSDACGYEVYIDDANLVVYVYWYYG